MPSLRHMPLWRAQWQLYFSAGCLFETEYRDRLSITAYYSEYSVFPVQKPITRTEFP